MADMRSPSQPLEAGVRIGDFEIEKLLGAGGMGIVYQARQVSLDRRVALKVLGPALTKATDQARFQREAQAAARLKHPGIAAIYFIGQDVGLCYHVMELVDGIPLQCLIERLIETQVVQTSPDSVVAVELTAHKVAPTMRFDDPIANNMSASPGGQPTRDDGSVPAMQSKVVLSPAAKQTRRVTQYIRRCCEIVRDAARALAYAHGEGVVHRDIKPANLMLDQGGRVRIIDFGLAKFFDDASITQTGQLVGTPLYMSPEQITGRITVDHRTDIYSLGLVLYELLALRRPFEVTSRENLLRNILTKALPPLRGQNAALPQALEAVVHKATHKDLEERYQSASELAEELNRFLEGKPVTAPPYRYRLDLQEIVGRRPRAVELTAAVLLILGSLALLIGGFVGLVIGVPAAEYGSLPLLLGGGAAAFGLTAFTSLQLLTGRNWAWWVVFALAMLIGAALVVAEVGVVGISTQWSSGPPPPGWTDADIAAARVRVFIIYNFPLLLGFLCMLTMVIALLLPSTRAWFHLAGQARREHQEMLRALGE